MPSVRDEQLGSEPRATEPRATEPRATELRATELRTDPLCMYLVVPARLGVPAGQLLTESALAAVRCVQSFASAPAYSAVFEEWDRSAARKICLGARPAAREELQSLAHAAIGDVLCFPPRRRSAAEPELASLRAHTGGPLQADDATDPTRLDGPTMVLLVARDRRLTFGKTVAQVAHAVLLGRRVHEPSAVSAWEARRNPVVVALTDDKTFRRAKAELIVAAVCDAGLTQVPAGTETVLALEPASTLPHWFKAAARPAR